MAVTTSNLIMGPATVYAGAFGSTEPTTVTEAPGAPFRDLGGTTDGVTLTIAQEYTELEVDQLVDIPGWRLTKREFTVETNMAEATLENLKFALNGGTITSGTGESVYEPATAGSATQPEYTALIIDGFAPDGKRRRVIIRKALSIDDVEFAYSKEDQTVLSVSLGVAYVSESIKPFRIIDEVAAG